MTHRAAARSFSRARRLNGPHAFAAVLAYKCQVSGALFQVFAKPNDRACARLGIVVARRILPRAVDRIYCKRIAREVFRTQALGDGVDFVVRPRVAFTRAAARAARAELGSLLARAQTKCRPANVAPPNDRMAHSALNGGSSNADTHG